MKKVDLKNYLTKVKKFNKGNNTLPILDYLLIQDQRIICSNLTITYSEKFTELDPNLNVLIDLKYLDQIVKKVKNCDIELNIAGKIISGKNTFSYDLLNEVDNFPNMNNKKSKDLGILKPETIKDLKEAILFVANDTLRPVMNFVNITENKIYSTNAHIAYFKDHNSEVKESFLFSPIAANLIPEENFKISRLYRNTGSELLDETIVLSNMNIEITYRMDSGKYPNVEAVIPKDVFGSLQVNKNEFNEVLSLSTIAASKTTKQIVLSLKDTVNVLSKDLDFKNEFSGEIENAKHNLDNYLIGLNSTFLTTCLKVCENELRFDFQELNNRAVIINKKVLIMPVMLN